MPRIEWDEGFVRADDLVPGAHQVHVRGRWQTVTGNPAKNGAHGGPVIELLWLGGRQFVFPQTELLARRPLPSGAAA